ncbi:MAG: HAD family hydrolase [Pseudomonadota bacterium]
MTLNGQSGTAERRAAAPASIRGVLFDKDGTLFDFVASWRGIALEIIARLAPDAAAAAAMARLGGIDEAGNGLVPGSLIAAGANRAIAEAWAPFRPDLGIGGMEAALERLAAEQAASTPPPVPAAPDLRRLLSELAGAGLGLGVATNDSAAGAWRDLKATGIDDAFDLVLGYDSVEQPKPAPDVIDVFAAHLGITPAEVAMVGDSTHDLMTAHAAGAGLAIGVLTGPAEASDLEVLADYILPSIAELPALFAQQR